MFIANPAKALAARYLNRVRIVGAMDMWSS